MIFTDTEPAGAVHPGAVNLIVRTEAGRACVIRLSENGVDDLDIAVEFVEGGVNVNVADSQPVYVIGRYRTETDLNVLIGNHRSSIRHLGGHA